ncbi:stage II sporulation protein D [Paenibacillus rigui]|uniref:Stage II sporulation protein D n=1 Tax=Paenibacillus rigui TaxID=554312 RepID=A0A229USQ3_9BACL|nr:stage II sporulation protein D [Paenibacillus rigui]OXM86390.1 stage II sporulation protein D [Paenibacillus rigui]
MIQFHRKRWIRWAVVCLSSFTVVILLVPAILVKSHGPSAVPTGVEAQQGAISEQLREERPFLIPVYLTKQRKVEQIPLETYVRGVLAGEMPIEFEPEAMKAQALAARTYIVRRVVEQDFTGIPADAAGAWVTDTVAHQAYVSDEELKERWGKAYTDNADKLDRAVRETSGMILTYEGKPIQATFFSTSNGYTENSEDYWNQYIPYLRSVPSPWDVSLSPRYKETVTMTAKELQSRLGLRTSVPASTGSGMKVLETSQGHRVKKMTVGGTIFTGRELREKLGLASSQFQWSWKGRDVLITTFGYGHGVGMSQWGANGMALEGRKAEEIVKYYYKGIAIQPADAFLPKPS